jgi:NADH dehydrogenase FAD-containing subunit
MSKKNIVIVGGGYAGVWIINNLQGKVPSYRIVLVEKQDFMFIRLAAARASSSEDISDRVLVPYDKLFKSPDVGVVLKASATAIKPHSVVLSEPHKLFGPEIDFDYLVLHPRETLLMIGHRHRKYLARSN